MTSTSTYGELVERLEAWAIKSDRSMGMNLTVREQLAPDLRQAAQALRIYEEKNGKLREALEKIGQIANVRYSAEGTRIALSHIETVARQALLTKEGEGASVARDADAPRFAAATEAQRKSEGEG